MGTFDVPFFTDSAEWTQLDVDTYIFWLQNELLHLVTDDFYQSNFSPSFRMICNPAISLPEYIDRLTKHDVLLMSSFRGDEGTITPFIVTYILIKRYFAITQQNLLPSDLDYLHKFIAVVFWIALKFVYDQELRSSDGANLLGFNSSLEINSLERSFLRDIKFNISFSHLQFQEAAQSYFTYKNIALFSQLKKLPALKADDFYQDQLGNQYLLLNIKSPYDSDNSSLSDDDDVYAVRLN